jgi:hypothetical protein
MERAASTLMRTRINGIVSLCFALMLSLCCVFDLWISIKA